MHFYLHMKLHFYTKHLGVHSHQLSISIMEVALKATAAAAAEKEIKGRT